MNTQRTQPRSGGIALPEGPNLFDRLAADRRRRDERREALAGQAADALVATLLERAPERSDSDLEDELCTRLGARLREWDDGPLDDHVDPNPFAAAVLGAAAEAVHATVDHRDPAPDAWHHPWRVLAAVARTVPYQLAEAAAGVMEQLRQLPGGHVLPKTFDEPAVTGPVLWTWDAYGSRFGITAPFSTPHGLDRWYLWDVDACGHQVVTVHSAYYPTGEKAQAAWRAGVGEVAAGGSAFTPVDDASLAAQLLPFEEGLLRIGGESAAQYAEYHRGKRLAEAVRAAIGPGHAAGPADRDPAANAAEFTAWLREHRAGPPPTELDELADSWGMNDLTALYHTCSPHRVALTVLHLRDYYQDDFAAQLVALLPDWISWLAARNGTPSDLVARCRPYALGEPLAGISSADGDTDYLARVIE